MKSYVVKLPILISLFTCVICINVNAQWTVGTPVNMQLTTLSHFGGGCTPSADFVFTIEGSQVTGVDFVGIVTSVPANSVYIIPGQDTLAAGDTIYLSPGMNSVYVYFFSGGGSVNFDFWAIGTPTVAGQLHPCSESQIWMSNLLLCEEGLISALTNNCTVQPSTGIDSYSALNPEIIYPAFENEYHLSINNASNISSVNVSDVQGKLVVSKSSLRNDKIIIPMTELSNGIYFLSFSSAGRYYSEKFLYKRR